MNPFPPSRPANENRRGIRVIRQPIISRISGFNAIGRRLRRWMFPLAGFFALVWFLIRVLPKPSRAEYPCQRAAFPLASAFVIWLAGALAAAAGLRFARFHLRRAHYVLGGLCLAAGMIGFAVSGSLLPFKARADYAPLDGANTPLGTPRGIFPGRVVWTRDANATYWDPAWDADAVKRYWDDDHTSQTLVDQMMSRTLRRLTSQPTDPAAWDALFRYFNIQRGKGDVGYVAGEKIAVKLSHVEQRSHPGNSAGTADNGNMADLSPQVVVALLKQLIEQAGVAQDKITLADPSRFIADKTYNRCAALYPNVIFVETNFYNLSRNPGTAGRTMSTSTSSTLLNYSGLSKAGSSIPADKLPMCFYEADYIIDLACMKGHPQNGVTLSGKNWYGALGDTGPTAHHDFWVTSDKTPEAGKYRSLVDMMGHKQLGGKAMLYVFDCLWGFQTHGATSHPVKWQNAPFNNDYPSSLFASQDPVAIDSVGIDFLRTEFADNMGGAGITGAIDDYMHEAALANNPPSGTFYDPENDGSRLASLGVHEHWNNSTAKFYTANLNAGAGVRLIALNSAAPSLQSAQVATGRSVDVTFSEDMDDSALAAANFTISGAGRGSLADHPSSVTWLSGYTYRLVWNTGWMTAGGDVTITASASVQDIEGNAIGSPALATHVGGGAPVPVAIDRAVVD